METDDVNSATAATGIPKSYISEDGKRVVIETNYHPSVDRCQMIFKRAWLPNGKAGWELSLCYPGTPMIHLDDEQAVQLAYGLRNAPRP